MSVLPYSEFAEICGAVWEAETKVSSVWLRSALGIKSWERERRKRDWVEGEVSVMQACPQCALEPEGPFRSQAWMWAGSGDRTAVDAILKEAEN